MYRFPKPYNDIQLRYKNDKDIKNMELYKRFDSLFTQYQNIEYDCYIESFINNTYYTEEKNIIDDKENSILSKLIGVIRDIFKKISTMVGNIIDKILGNDEQVAVPQNFEKDIMKKKAWYDKFGELISKIAGGIKGIGMLILKFMKKHPVVTTVAVASIILIPGGRYKELLKIAQVGFNTASDALNKLFSKSKNISSEDKNQLTTLLHASQAQAKDSEGIIKKTAKKIVSGGKTVMGVSTSWAHLMSMYNTVSSIPSYMSQAFSSENDDEVKRLLVTSPQYIKIIGDKKLSDDQKAEKIYNLYKKIKSEYKK